MGICLEKLLQENDINVAVKCMSNKGCVANYGYRHLSTKDCSWIYEDCSHCWEKVFKEILSYRK